MRLRSVSLPVSLAASAPCLPQRDPGTGVDDAIGRGDVEFEVEAVTGIPDDPDVYTACDPDVCVVEAPGVDVVGDPDCAVPDAPDGCIEDPDVCVDDDPDVGDADDADVCVDDDPDVGAADDADTSPAPDCGAASFEEVADSDPDPVGVAAAVLVGPVVGAGATSLPDVGAAGGAPRARPGDAVVTAPLDAFGLDDLAALLPRRVITGLAAFSSPALA